MCIRDRDISSKVVPVVENVTGDAQVQTQKVAGTNEVIIKTKTLSVEERQNLDQAMVDNFGVEAEKITAESISGAISKEMKQDAFIAVIIATICMPVSYTHLDVYKRQVSGGESGDFRKTVPV